MMVAKSSNDQKNYSVFRLFFFRALVKVLFQTIITWRIEKNEYSETNEQFFTESSTQRSEKVWKN